MGKKKTEKKGVYLNSRKVLSEELEKVTQAYQDVLEDIGKYTWEFNDLVPLQELIDDRNVNRKTISKEFDSELDDLFDKYDALRKKVNLFGEILDDIGSVQKRMDELKR